MNTPSGIFLAEDSPADVYLIKEALKAHAVEHELFVVADGAAAVAFLEQDDSPVPALFVLDLNLPRVNGLDILKHLRSTPKFATCRVLILTGSTNPDDRNDAMRLGATQYVEKAVEIEDFLKIGREIKILLRPA